MKKKTENWLVFMFVSLVGIVGLLMMFGNSSITGAAYNPICQPVYSEATGEYYITCSATPWIKNPGFEGYPPDLDSFSEQGKLEQFPRESWKQKYSHPIEPSSPEYKGTPYSMNYKDSNIGIFDREKWLKRHGLEE